MSRLYLVVLLWSGLSAAAPPAPCELETVRFAPNELRLGADAQAALTRAAACIQARDGKVRVEAHSDGRGTPEYALSLAQRQAQVVKTFLVSKGAAETRLTLLSFGNDRPLCTAKTRGCRAKNRRVELHFD